ncbi:hypothetical protein LWI28_023062 [Acer negundo]|uniref:Uncharacterized protein n=1 Tax=Acer negundo TaxID=4023 RepID=A0AAD5JH13_ACENE|nr:hypothetical protein LWI28_023062 [Acer negundo]
MHFVLVHGACHGAWCWYKVATLLKTAGHRVTALDMAASGTHPSQLHDIPSMSDYFKPLMEFMASLPPEERVILVGHSMGGYCISAAMESFPHKVSVAVFCTAFMPSPDLTFTTLSAESNRRLDSLMNTVITFANGPNNQPTSILFGPDCMLSKLYQLSPPEELANRSLTSVPPRYVHIDKDPPIISLNSSSPQVPVIDMQKLLSEDFKDLELHKLDCACKEWGFFQLINHEVSKCLVEKFKSEIGDFFKLPIEEKNKYKQQEGDVEGYGNAFVVSEEQKLDWGDMLYFTTLPIHLRKPHLLPNLPLSFSHEKLIFNIRGWLDSFGQAAVEFCSRVSNSYADILAKKGADSSEDELV